MASTDPDDVAVVELEEEDDDDELLIAPTGAMFKSSVWQHFGYKKSDEMQNNAICKICKVAIPTTSANTSGMRAHLKRRHLIDVPSIAIKKTKDDNQKATLSSIWNRQKPYATGSTKKMQLDKALAKFIAIDLQPFSVVEDEGFNYLLHKLDPQYIPPSRKHITSKLLPSMLEEVTANINKEIAGAQFMSLTTDGWTSRATESYLTVTCHFLNCDWQMQSYVLDTSSLSEQHTAQNLADQLAHVVGKWKINEQLSSVKPLYITTDNAANIVKACQIGNFKNLKCFAHTLNLAAQKGLNTTLVSNMLAHIRRIVKYFHKSTTASAVLSERQGLEEMPKHKLILDVSTRWNSTYEMIDRFREQHPAIAIALYSSKLNPSEQANYRSHFEHIKLDLLETFCAILKPLYDATHLVSSEKTTTVSVIHPLKHQIISKLEVEESDPPIVKALKQGIASDLVNRYTDVSTQNFLLMSTALDPRFKSLSHISKSARKEVIEHIIDSVDRIKAVDTHSNIGVMNPTVDDESTDVARASCISDTKQSALDNLFGAMFAVPKQSDSLSAAFEVQVYENHDVIGLNECPLKWWKQHEKTIPFIARLAKQYLSVQATSVPSERIFSTAGEIVSAKRSRISHDNVNTLIFLNKNMPKP